MSEDITSLNMLNELPETKKEIGRYGSEVEHYIATHSGDPSNIDNAIIVDAFWAGITVKECGRKIIKYQQEQEQANLNKQQT